MGRMLRDTTTHQMGGMIEGSTIGEGARGRSTRDVIVQPSLGV